ncbi:hypothetical protein BJ875DRAFT_451289 [Amylocarpus encephaloides]|uniref:DUF5672 domain-containing protein n=1 Tax=Amylocarpus encephaloides TaxID=45428 RepID=A0A9P7YSC2_9HELO|nr:hypothetical protein BJ875DRAFT_451289 [Amylocarpus encephaloides]
MRASQRIAVTAAFIVIIAVSIIITSTPIGGRYRLLVVQPPKVIGDVTVPPKVNTPPAVAISNEKAAVIVESRPLENLIPIILHFSSVLGPEWPVHVFTTKPNMGLFADSDVFQRNVGAGRFQVRPLPEDETLKSNTSVSAFFTKPWIWEQMAPAQHVLLFQADSILCSKAPQRMEEFLEYDFVGAPIRRNLGIRYNGGLSLRNRTMCLDITRNHDWLEDSHGENSKGELDYEDQWFRKKIEEYPGSTLPESDVAVKFSVETLWYDKPLGFHQPDIWQKEHMAEIYKWCPEYRMCTTE